MSHQWEDIENYIQSAIVLATGYPSDQVIWKHQNRNAPTMDYAAISLGSIIQIGQDLIRYSTNTARPAGQEIQQKIFGLREVPLEIEVYTDATSGNDCARAILERAKTSLRLPSIKYELRRGGIAPFDPGAVQSIPDIYSVGFRGRAACTVRCYVVMPEVVEYCGYISRVRGTVTYWTTASGYSGGASGSTGYSLIFDTNNA